MNILHLTLEKQWFDPNGWKSRRGEQMILSIFWPYFGLACNELIFMARFLPVAAGPLYASFSLISHCAQSVKPRFLSQKPSILWRSAPFAVNKLACGFGRISWVASAALIGCGSGGKTPPQITPWPGIPTTAPWITKSPTVLNTHGETTPVMFMGALRYVSCDRDTLGRGSRINVFDAAGVLLTTVPNQMAFCSALVTPDGALHVFGTTYNGDLPNSVVHVTTADMLTWTPPVVVLNAPLGTQIFNTSVAPDPTGYVMAYEICANGQVCYNFRFAKSIDLLRWADVGSQFDGVHYAGCPTIRYSGGYYYAMFLGEYAGGISGSIYSTKIARSADMLTWAVAKQDVLSPLNGGDVSGNASDVDLLDQGGTVLLVYENGSQVGVQIPNTGTRLAYYAGTIDQMFSKFVF